MKDLQVRREVGTSVAVQEIESWSGAGVGYRLQDRYATRGHLLLITSHHLVR